MTAVTLAQQRAVRHHSKEQGCNLQVKSVCCVNLHAASVMFTNCTLAMHMYTFGFVSPNPTLAFDKDNNISGVRRNRTCLVLHHCTVAA